MSIEFSKVVSVKDAATKAIEVIKLSFEVVYTTTCDSPYEMFKSKLKRLKEDSENITDLDVDFYNCVSIAEVKTIINDPAFIPISFIGDDVDAETRGKSEVIVITGSTYCSAEIWSKYTDNYVKLLLYMIISDIVSHSVDDIELKEYNIIVSDKFRYSLIKR